MNIVDRIIAKVEPLIPNAVLIRASKYQLPMQSIGAPAVAKAANARIIPSTVPIRPISTEIEAMVDKITRFFESIGNSSAVASSRSFCKASTFWSFAKFYRFAAPCTCEVLISLHLQENLLFVTCFQSFFNFISLSKFWISLTNLLIRPLPLARLNEINLSIE